mgnify:CR=1 FL=1
MLLKRFTEGVSMTKKTDSEPMPAEQQSAEPVSTPLSSLAEQIGQHVIAALNQESTVAVVTTITGSRVGRQVVSLPLDSDQMHNIQMLLMAVETSEQPETVSCVGFHCKFDSTDV